MSLQETEMRFGTGKMAKIWPGEFLRRVPEMAHLRGNVCRLPAIDAHRESQDRVVVTHGNGVQAELPRPIQ